MNDSIQILQQLAINTKPQGLVRKIKSKYPDIFKYIEEFQKNKCIDNVAEAIFLIIHKMDSKPLCISLTNKCISKVRFKSMVDGYSQYCSKCILKSIEYQDKIKKTNLDRYGVENPMQRKEIVEKAKRTTMETYGVESINQLEFVKSKKKQTLKNHFGETGLAHESITAKKKKTNLNRRGVEWATQTEETQNKRKNTCFDRYGVDNVMHLSDIQDKVRKSLHSDEFIKYVHSLIESRGYHLVSEYDHAHENVTIHCDKCNNDFDILWNSFQQGGGVCPTCYPKNNGISYQEKEISQYVQSLGFSIIENDRLLIRPMELDIIIHDKKIAIEYCGLWCHSSGGNAPYLRDKNYHITKLEKCIEKEYQLITIFEDEWIINKDIVKSRLRYLLGKSDSMIKIRASKCVVEHIEFSTKSKFLKENHLQGDKVSQINFGLFHNDILVSVMTFSKKSNFIYELDRFCNLKDVIIYGAASKLLQSFQKEYTWSMIISYADRRWSTGNVYNKLGFSLDSTTQPNYWYWGKSIKGRKHRLNFSKSRLRNMEFYDPSLTEFQIMALEKYAWIYDCGNYKFIMENK